VFNEFGLSGFWIFDLAQLAGLVAALDKFSLYNFL
jgi:hypothetical protein